MKKQYGFIIEDHPDKPFVDVEKISIRHENFHDLGHDVKGYYESGYWVIEIPKKKDLYDYLLGNCWLLGIKKESIKRNPNSHRFCFQSKTLLKDNQNGY